jgi:hypothetical protein
MGYEPPIIHLSYQWKLNLHHTMRVGDLFIFNNFTIIRIYCFELEPYQLPVYISPRFFPLEFSKQRFND